jgi:hypothetical protein
MAFGKSLTQRYVTREFTIVTPDKKERDRTLQGKQRRKARKAARRNP